MSLVIVRGLDGLSVDFASLGLNASAVVYGPVWDSAVSLSCMDETFVATQAINAGFFAGSGQQGVPSPWRSWRSFAFPAFDAFWNSSVAGNTTPPGVPLPPNASKVHILLLGDSVDRGNIEQACKFWNRKNNWAHDALWLQPDSAGGGKIPGRDEFLVCDTPWGSAEIIHTYGAQQRESHDICAPRHGSVCPSLPSHRSPRPGGGYHHGYNGSSPKDGPLVHTENRLPAIAAQYMARRGHAPDVVVYQSVLWTAKKMASDDSQKSVVSSVHQFMRDYAVRTWSRMTLAR